MKYIYIYIDICVFQNHLWRKQMFQCRFKTARQWFANFWPPKTAKLLITEVSGYSHPWIKHIETRNASFLASFGSDLGICVASLSPCVFSPKKQPKKPKNGPFQTESRLPTTIFSCEILVFGGVHNIMLIVFLSPKKKQLALDIQLPKLEVFGAPKHTAQTPNLRRALDVQGL